MEKSTKAMEAVLALRKMFTEADKGGYLNPVWRILGAMRGPDSDSEEEKLKWVTPVRRAVLSRRQAKIIGVSNCGTFQECVYTEQPSVNLGDAQDCCTTSTHFNVHIRQAYPVLEAARKQMAEPEHGMGFRVQNGMVAVVGEFPETREGALLASIAKWNFIAAHTTDEAPLLDGGPDTCALCHLYRPGACEECPVKERTGKSCCEGTPYECYDGHNRGVVGAAKAEVDFLMSLLAKYAL